MAVTIVGITIDRYLASQLEPGSMTVMAYATRLIQFPLGLVATATSFAVLPTLSMHAARFASASADSDRQGFTETLAFGMKIVLLLMVPATLGLSLLSEPIVRLLFEHRAFTSEDTFRTARVFLFYAPQLPFTALDQLFIFAFYARRDTVTPVLVGILGVGFYLVVALATRGSLGVYGLALANAVQNSVHALILLGLLWRTVGKFPVADLVRFLARVLLASALMWVGLSASLQLLEPLVGRTVPGLLILVVTALALGPALYALLTYAFRLPEAHQLVRLVRARAWKS
jgi:putative peptidoglycan lipid II flippase